MGQLTDVFIAGHNDERPEFIDQILFYFFEQDAQIVPILITRRSAYYLSHQGKTPYYRQTTSGIRP
ncbi:MULTISPECIES: hypothetical protein [unclassified Raoultella]|uniref:hypothetical protein n=1 Tax=unclassified Raoultella TaxID=2627600 RepID=UPI001357ABF0|nr:MULTISPECIES: hypothetical protein [unclassified Raoultella]